MDHIRNTLMKLGGSLGIAPQKFKKTCYKNSIHFGLLVHFQEYDLYRSKRKELEYVFGLLDHPMEYNPEDALISLNTS
jgi:hypothetical protein